MARVAKPGDGAGPWCSICGRMVSDLEPSLDPTHPIGVCAYDDEHGERRGHGRVPAVSAITELLAIRQRRIHDRNAKRHFAHLADIPVIGCPVCKSKYPTEYRSRLEGRKMAPGDASRSVATAGHSPRGNGTDRGRTDSG